MFEAKNTVKFQQVERKFWVSDSLIIYASNKGKVPEVDNFETFITLRTKNGKGIIGALFQRYQ